MQLRLDYEGSRSLTEMTSEVQCDFNALLKAHNFTLSMVLR